MHRRSIAPRGNWQGRVEGAGLVFHTLENDQLYWDESACYEFTAAEIDTLEAAGNTLQTMCLAAAQHVIDEKRYPELDIPEQAIKAIEWAWNNESPALYGRFDIAWNGTGSPKLLEYNADTPTSLLEAAVVQWDWLKELTPQLPKPFSGGDADQFNSIHDKLIAKWKDLDPYLEARLLRRCRLARRPAHPRLSPRHCPAGRPSDPPDVHGRDWLERRAPGLCRSP